MRFFLMFGLAGLAIGCSGLQTLTLDERSRVIEAPYDLVYEAAVLGLGANGLTVTTANREAGMLAVGTALAPVAALFPPEYEAKVAVPVGIALAWLGYALWSEEKHSFFSKSWLR